MEEYRKPFETYKYCEFCGKPLPKSYKEDCCPECIERQLFSHVKDYIREHDVNEYEVAHHFGIPVNQVKMWIREGRIEYKEHQGGTIAGVRCQHCGAAVTFGTLCPKCLKLMNSRKVYGRSYGPAKGSTKMHFMDKENEEE